jgi:Xaa-Pro aminopeptidase
MRIKHVDCCAAQNETKAMTNLAFIRQQLKKHGLSGIFIPRADEYQGEYVPPSAERLLWATDFTGSWGQALIGLSKAALVVDGRYTIQAAKQTKGSGIELLGVEKADLQGFMTKAFKPKSKLGFDPWTTSTAEAKRLQALCKEVGLELAATKTNLVDAAWQDRPAPPANPVVSHPLKYAGVSSDEKLKAMAAQMKRDSIDAAVLADPHSVAWALNVRGSDIGHTPLALLRAVVFQNGTAKLFVDKSRIAKGALSKRVEVVAPDKLPQNLKQLSKRTVLVDSSNCPEAIRLALVAAKANIREGMDPCVMPRAQKNATEQRGARNAHIRDGAAMANFLCWFENTAPKGTLTEVAAQNKLLEFRQATGKLQDTSFGSISASGPNAAQPHYHAVGKSGRRIPDNSIYLIDSGGQYLDGTTDITRTVIVGKPTAKMKEHFTLVLKGMIAVAMARFPAGTTGTQIDAMARSALWQHGYDFDHGTGHGVGSFLSVHEGPARISKAGTVAFLPGMMLSNEPGYYLSGKYGIRIENLLIVKPAEKPKGGDRKMLSFENLTCCPIDRNLIDQHILTRAELKWLDAYHAEVHAKLKSLVLPETLGWLEAACAPLT